ncbi:Uma2 family endonuclease [Actinomycetospora atypica]|uniref:Uma2 family endonuclease n=1 Tax=Actinomycetospora atypica TaxID=1290095 RepID=A0ABV9YLV4_9PSEU
MTAAGRAWPSRPPDHLLDLAEWEALPEDDSARYELVEGVMVVSPRPVFRHQDIVFELCRQLRDHLAEGLTALPEVELVVDDGGGGGPATVRVPDLVVVPVSLVPERARAVAGDVVAVLEVLSPGTRRTDRVAKLAEYAEVGIAHYVIVDPEGPISEFVLDGHAYRPVATHHQRAVLAFGPTIALPSP